jgi:hypothetical protein
VPFFGRLRLRELTAVHVPAFKARKVEEGLNPNTVGVMQGVLSTALNQAVDNGLIPSNPASRVKKAATRGQSPMRPCPRKRPQGSYGPLWARETRPDNPRAQNRDAPGRAHGSKVEDVDLASKPSITVRRSADTRTKARVSTTKSGEEHMIRIGPRTVEALKAHRAWQLEEAGLLDVCCMD